MIELSDDDYHAPVPYPYSMEAIDTALGYVYSEAYVKAKAWGTDLAQVKRKKGDKPRVPSVPMTCPACIKCWRDDDIFEDYGTTYCLYGGPFTTREIKHANVF